MDRVDEVSCPVEKGAEVHPVTLVRRRVLCRHIIAIDHDVLLHQLRQVTGHDRSFGLVGHQLERIAQREPQVFDLVEGVFKGRARQFRGFVLYLFGFEQGGHPILQAHFVDLHIGLPKQFTLVSSGEPKGVDLDQNGDLLYGDGYPVDEVVQVGKASVLVSFLDDSPGVF